MPGTVLSKTARHVCTITLNRPGARNALNSELMADLVAALSKAELDSGVRVIILTGAGPAFCAGMDLHELSNPKNGLSRLVRARVNPWSMIRSSSKPVIGAVNGPAVTGGLELALSCDFLIASDRATFADTHTRVGSLPGQGMSVLLPQAVGLRKAKEMAYTGEFLSASEALRLHLVNKVVTHSALLGTARAVAGEIIRSDVVIVGKTKRLYDASAEGTTADAMKRERREFNRWPLPATKVEERSSAIIEGGSKQIRRRPRK
jgi:enoyl-CoA hydratase